MKQIHGIWLPDGDEHFRTQLGVGPMIDGKATYQYPKYRTAMKYVREKRHAVDVGAHVGLWSRIMAKDFERVTSLEPLAEHRACFHRNVTAENVRLLPVAAGMTKGTVRIHMPQDNTGNSHVLEHGEECVMVDLDSLPLGPIDLLKIDVEGYEQAVIFGAERTIREARPVMVVEQKKNNAERYGWGRWDAVSTLKSWGMKEAEVIRGDHVMVW